MKAVCWFGKHDIRVISVAEPRILSPRDAVVRVTLTSICGSDLHLYDGLVPTMMEGDILGHEFVGEVVDIGPEVGNLKVGDRVVVPFTIACGRCFFCQRQLWSLCDNSNPNAWMAAKLYGCSPSGLFGSGHLMGGYAGGQAEYVRVPFADVGPMKLPEALRDDQALFLSDTFPTGYMAAENCGIEPGDTIAVFGCGPVGLFAIRSCYLLGAAHVIAIDSVQYRLDMAHLSCGAQPLNFEGVNVLEALQEFTAGRGPDACIDAVGMEAHGSAPGMVYDWAKQAARLQTDRPTVLRQAIQACRKGGTISIPGFYGGFLDKIPFGAAFAKGLTLKMGQTHVQRHMPPLLDRIITGQIDPSFVITHRATLDDAPAAYSTFKHHQDGCVNVVMSP